ncbi:terminal uridylyltransferase 4-like [Sorghum bicolor]|uniref:terminal uridylyltransferase 4-like n=1 Tax=Sorghum bicolor TaxID=4558 RepID=UPI000B4259F8|nr:terminal uridylyltransferase 4-like [Sorghum bicolor]|eukprot:XP_021305492.1 terminal uridylyltransferase 4-like [Sorghum bicolor]
MKPNVNPAPTGNTCFKCGQLGHYANACPQRQRNNNNNGRVNHVKLETAEEAPDVQENLKKKKRKGRAPAWADFRPSTPRPSPLPSCPSGPRPKPHGSGRPRTHPRCSRPQSLTRGPREWVPPVRGGVFNLRPIRTG